MGKLDEKLTMITRSAAARRQLDGCSADKTNAISMQADCCSVVRTMVGPWPRNDKTSIRPNFPRAPGLALRLTRDEQGQCSLVRGLSLLQMIMHPLRRENEVRTRRLRLDEVQGSSTAVLKVQGG